MPDSFYTAVTETTYRCTECNAEDHDRGTNLPAPQFLVCWNCDAGRGVEPSEMIRRRKGMFPVANEEEQQEGDE